MRRTLRIALSLASLAAAACSLLVDTSGLTGGLEDASVDAPSMRDADTEADAVPADAGSDADAGDARCTATFCDDFDEGLLGERWTDGDKGTSGELSLVASDASPPNALRAVLLSPTNSDEAFAFIEKNLGRGKAVRCDVMVFIKTPPNGTKPTDLLSIRTSGPGIPNFDLRFGLTSTGASLRQDVSHQDGGCECPRSDFAPSAVPQGRWVRVSIETDFMTATLRYDGTPVAGGNVGGFVPTGEIGVGLGVEGYAGQTTDVLFDDFRCAVTP